MVTSYVMRPIEDIQFGSIIYKKEKQYCYIKDSDYLAASLIYDEPKSSNGYGIASFTREMKKYFKKVQECPRSIYIDRNALSARMKYDDTREYILEYLFDLPSKNKIVLYSQERRSFMAAPKENFMSLDEFLKKSNTSTVDYMLSSIGSKYIEEKLQNYNLSSVKIAPIDIEMN